MSCPRVRVSPCVCVCLALAVAGCNSEPAPGPPKSNKTPETQTTGTLTTPESTITDESTEPGSKTSPSAEAVPAENAPGEARKTSATISAAALFSAPPAEMPEVLLTDGHAKTCLVTVGDAMPDLELPDLEGKPQTLGTLLGEKLTVVAFWTSSQPYAVEELGDLGVDVAAPFSAEGVKVVAINERDSAEAARKVVEQVGAGHLVNLLDAQGEALAKVAVRKLPRTYLLDATGKILWFDIEYSRSTRRELMQAIHFVLAGK